MPISIPTLVLLALTATSSATPTNLAPRQGGYYVSVGNKYAGPGCTQLIYADPIFGNGNVCQDLDRTGTGAPIRSYETLRSVPGCSVSIYTEANCTGTAFAAPAGGCVTGNSPFVSTYVTCV